MLWAEEFLLQSISYDNLISFHKQSHEQDDEMKCLKSWMLKFAEIQQFLKQLCLYILKSCICNGTTPVSSLKASVELSARTWPRPRMNMWIPEELPGTAQSYTGAMSMILMRLARMTRLACCSVTTSYPWMLLFSLLIRLACSL